MAVVRAAAARAGLRVRGRSSLRCWRPGVAAAGGNTSWRRRGRRRARVAEAGARAAAAAVGVGAGEGVATTAAAVAAVGTVGCSAHNGVWPHEQGSNSWCERVCVRARAPAHGAGPLVGHASGQRVRCDATLARAEGHGSGAPCLRLQAGRTERPTSPAHPWTLPGWPAKLTTTGMASKREGRMLSHSRQQFCIS